MSVLIYAENWDGKFKKSTFEAVSYGFDAAQKLDKEVSAIVIGKVEEDELKKLGQYGASNIIYVEDEGLKQQITPSFAEVVEAAVNENNTDLVILPHSFNGKALAGRLSAKLKAGIVSGAVEGISTDDGFSVKKGAFSGKGFAHVKIISDKKIVTVTTNSFGVKENPVDPKIETKGSNLSQGPSLEIIDQEKVTGKIPLTDAELVVSAGRGLKSPDNWDMIEELADLIGAGTACSKPVSDMEWRPHSEHVGQTGITISPNLYIAIGISGAIQHQAGVNSSKTIVVINKDPEAPFFKVADYGIVGDAFEVVPKLIGAAKAAKS